MDGSVDAKNGLEHTVGDKSLGLLSTMIDKVLTLKGEETQFKCSPEHAERANIDLTLVQVAKKHGLLKSGKVELRSPIDRGNLR